MGGYSGLNNALDPTPKFLPLLLSGAAPRGREVNSFLSEAYSCKQAWQKRLQSPLFQKVRPDGFYFDLDRKFQLEKKASPIDIDLFSNMERDEHHLDELESITRMFRRCPNTVHVLPSTGHAVIRTFLQLGATDTLMRMLHDKLNYGLFPDYYMSNLLMDNFLSKGNNRDAVKIAIEIMLQEDFTHPIASQLALYSAYAYLKNPTPEPWDPQPVPPPEEPAEDVKVRVDYIREPYFDDHFDLTEPNPLIGKTLAYLGKHFRQLNHNDGRKTNLLLCVNKRKSNSTTRTMHHNDKLLASVLTAVLDLALRVICGTSGTWLPPLVSTYSEAFVSLLHGTVLRARDNDVHNDCVVLRKCTQKRAGKLKTVITSLLYINLIAILKKKRLLILEKAMRVWLMEPEGELRHLLDSRKIWESISLLCPISTPLLDGSASLAVYVTRKQVP
nr:EOG090X05Q1 [Triops cancriformis]